MSLLSGGREDRVSKQIPKALRPPALFKNVEHFISELAPKRLRVQQERLPI